MRFVRRSVRLFTLYGIAAFAGYLASFAHVPLAWVLGPLIAAAIMSIAGIGVLAPVQLRRAGQVVIGATAGLSVTGPILGQLALWIPVMVGTALISVFVAATVSGVLAHFARIDVKTSFFAMLPGGLSEMGTIGMKAGASVEPIAMIHTFRTSLVVLIIPAVLASSSRVIVGDAVRPDLPIELVTALVSVCIGGALLARLVQINNPWMIGALVASSTVSAADYFDGHMPDPIFIGAQVLLGFNIGSQFRREALVKMPRVAVVGTACILLLLGAMALYALGLSQLTSLEYGTALLTSSPGGTSEMTTTARALHLPVAMVTLFHLIRSFLVNGFAALYWRGFERSGYIDLVRRAVARLC